MHYIAVYLNCRKNRREFLNQKLHQGEVPESTLGCRKKILLLAHNFFPALIIIFFYSCNAIKRKEVVGGSSSHLLEKNGKVLSLD